MGHRTLYLAAYDVRCHRRRPRVLRAVRDFSAGGQKSAYEVWLNPQDRKALEGAVRAQMNLSEDCFALVPIERRAGPQVLGAAVQPVDPDFFYFG